MVKRRWAAVGIALIASATLLTVGRTAVADEPTALHVPYGAEARTTKDRPADFSPPGSNDWGCKPSERHPNPVVLVHGLGANQWENWQTIAPLLANEGYCVYSLTYGRNPLAPPGLDQIGGLKRMEDSARELSHFVDKVREATEADKVDIVGHSEGSLMPNYYVKFLGGARYVDHYVGLTPLWDGTKLLGLHLLYQAGKPFGLSAAASATLAPLCDSCTQFLHGSDFIKKMNSGGGPAVDGVKYTMIMTRYDELVIPYTSGIMHNGDAKNTVLQEGCPNDVAEHAGVAYDPVTAQHVLNALDPEHSRAVDCYATSAQRSESEPDPR